MSSLLRRANPAARGLDWELAGALPTGVLAVLLCGAAPGASLAEGLPGRIVGVQALAVLLLSAIVPVQSRCSRFQLGLPVSARQLWIDQMRGLLARAVAILAVAGASAVACQLALKGEVAPPGLAVLLARLAAAYLLGIAVLQAPHPSLHRIPFRPGYFLLVCGVLAALVTWLLAVGAGGAPDWPWVMIVALGMTALDYRAVPEAYGLQPALPLADAARGRPGSLPRLPQPLQLGRWLLGHAFWFYPPLLALMGFLVTGTRGFSPTAASMWLFYLLMATMHLVTLVTAACDRLGSIDHLPVPRHRLLAVLVTPGLAFTLVGYAAGEAFARLQEVRRPVLAQCVDDRPSCFDPPLALYEPAGVATPPAVEAPWGERHRLRPVPILPGSPIGLVSPWEVPPDSSLDFAAWQLSRALADVYGVESAPEQLRRRYLEPSSEGAAPGIGVALLQLTAGRTPRTTRGRVPLGLLCLVMAATWSLYAAFRLNRGLAGHLALSGRWRSGTWGLPLGLGWLLGVMVPIATALGEAEAWALPALVEALSRMASGAGWWAEAALAAAALGLAAAGYRLAAREYARLEAPRFAPGRASLTSELQLDV